jgi:hypothetical protein
MMTRKSVKLVREGKFVAEVDVELIETPDNWAPYLSPHDAARLDAVRKLLRDGKPAQARQRGRVYELKPLPA